MAAHHGCTADGFLNDQKFSSPMPWIGLYIASASAACLLAMAADLAHGFRHRKLWFPCKFFSINATTLTLVAVAIKLSLDLNTSMPGRIDQLAKLSSVALTCTLMANSMPSLGTMSSDELLSNVAALAILVVTLAVNVSIQLATGAIFVFWKEHALLMLLMLLLLLLLSFSALTVPTTKRYLEYKYALKHRMALSEAPPDGFRNMLAKLRDDMTKYWVMAHTCSPQFVVARSATCTASGALCLLSAGVLAEAVIRSFFLPRSLRFCRGESDYEWSTKAVLATQVVAVGVGTMAPAFRWLSAVRFRCPYRGNKKGPRSEFRVEKYWVQMLEEMKECPMTSAIFKLKSRRNRRFFHNTKNRVLDLCITTQIAIVFSSKLIRFVSVFSASKVLLLCDLCASIKGKLLGVVNDGAVEERSLRTELGRFVLHLEGEEALVDRMILSNCDSTKYWFSHGRKRQPNDLIKLLEKSSEGFGGLALFDSHRVPSLAAEDPPNSWTLSVVTLTTIALALPGVDPVAVENLRRGVTQGLFYVKNMEKYLDTKADLSNLRKAAEVTWTEVDLYDKWLGLDLRDEEKGSPRQVLERLGLVARTKFEEQRNVQTAGCLAEDPLRWHVRLLAANAMYRVSQSLLLVFHHHQSGDATFEGVSRVISDILCACMTNLHQVISVKCLNSSIEMREESVRRGVLVLGKAQEILNILDRREIPGFSPKQMGCINAWRLWVHDKSDSEMDSSGVTIAVD